MSETLPANPACLPLLSGAATSGSECAACRGGKGLPFSFSMAFQPIVDIEQRQVFAYEALVRGPQGQPAGWVLQQLTPEIRYVFDQGCRVCAIRLASKLGIARRGARLAVNFMPGAVYSPAACIRRTLQAAEEFAFPLSSLTFEITEVEQVQDPGHLQKIVDEYRRRGFTVALDDFGAGYSNLNLLAELEGVDELKLDARLIRNIDTRPRAQTIVRRVVELCRELDIRVVGEGVQTLAELSLLRSYGVSLLQGYLFARPLFEALPEIDWPEREALEREEPAPSSTAQL